MRNAFGRFVALTVTALGVFAPLHFALSAQTAPAVQAPAVTALSGQIDVIPNAGLRQITVSFSSAVPLNGKSSQIVFVLRANLESLPKPWSGVGRILYSDGVLVVSPEGNEKDPLPLSFSFAEKALPPSLRDWKTEHYTVYQIARYGEFAPLTPQQVKELSATGTYTA